MLITLCYFHCYYGFQTKSSWRCPMTQGLCPMTYGRWLQGCTLSDGQQRFTKHIDSTQTRKIRNKAATTSPSNNRIGNPICVCVQISRKPVKEKRTSYGPKQATVTPTCNTKSPQNKSNRQTTPTSKNTRCQLVYSKFYYSKIIVKSVVTCDHLNNRLNQSTHLTKSIENRMRNRIMCLHLKEMFWQTAYF